MAINGIGALRKTAIATVRAMGWTLIWDAEVEEYRLKTAHGEYFTDDLLDALRTAYAIYTQVHADAVRVTTDIPESVQEVLNG